MAETLLDVETDVREDEETVLGPGEVAHILLAIDALIGYSGNEVEALCGYRWVPTKPVAGKPICQQCKAVYDDGEAIVHANDRVREKYGL